MIDWKEAISIGYEVPEAQMWAWHRCFPLRRAEQFDLVRGFRRGLFESRSEVRRVHLARSSSAAALPSQAAQGHPVNTGRESRGGLLWVTFLGRARKVTSRRAAPGLLLRSD